MLQNRMDTTEPLNHSGYNSSACSSTVSASNTYEGVTTTLLSGDEYSHAVADTIEAAVQRMAHQEDDDDEDYVSVGHAVAAAVPPTMLPGDIVGGLTFIEESGYSDPLGGKDFDLLDYLNDENSNINTPMDSPAEFGHLQQQQQQQLLLGNVNGVGYGNYANSATANIQTPVHLDNNLLYAANNNAVVRHVMISGATGGGASGGVGGNRGSRLPDSPPITDISAGGLSSASPSSGGSASGDSPFSPTSISTDLYARNYQHTNSLPINDDILLSMHGYHNNGLANGSGNTNGMNSGDLQQQMLHQRMMMQHQLQQQQHQQQPSSQKLSPSSEFLSPFPPCQSAPGSQHSSSSGVLPNAQISPSTFSANVENAVCGANGVNTAGSGMRGSGYVLQQQQNQQQQRPYEQLPSVKGEIQQTPNGGYKRRRTDTGRVNGGGASLMSSVKSENGGMFNNAANGNGGSRTNLSYAQMFQSERSGSSNSGGAGSGNGNGGGAEAGSGSSSLNGDAPTSMSGGTQSAAPLSNHSNDYDFDDTASMRGSSQKSIKFTPFLSESWLRLYDSCNRAIDQLSVHIVADKGFNYFATENCFVNQKKNHFQITVHIDRMGGEPPYWIQLPTGELQQINEYRLQFCGVKSEMPSSEVAINQSQSDRKPVALDGIELKMNPSTMTKQTVPRLHFSQTTMNNHRKNGKSNPEQKFFLLVVKLAARTALGDYVIQAYQSDRVIVRASNPGQFEQPECGVAWQQSASDELLHFNGQVAIGTDKPLDADAKLSVMGNVFTTGQVTRPSDRRVKEDIAEVDTSEAMSRISQMRIVEYNYKKEIAEKWGIEQNRHRVGVIAQELGEVLPDAVRDNGEFLTVDDTRIFYDTVAAAQELYRLTGNLECKIDQVEKISQKLARFAQRRRQLGSMASGISDFSTLFGTTTPGLTRDKAFLSQSRVSLTSAPAAPYAATSGGNEKAKERKSKRHAKEDIRGYRRCRSVSSASSYSYCHRGRVPDNALCSSKVTQGTIVTLVVIMALCLVAMCTLYVMDWYNRTYIYAPPLHYQPRGGMDSPYLSSSTHYRGGIDGGGVGADLDANSGVGHIVAPYDSANPWSALMATMDSAGRRDLSLAGSRCTATDTRRHCPVFCCAASPEVLAHGIAADRNSNNNNIQSTTALPLELRAMSLGIRSANLTTGKSAENLLDENSNYAGQLESGVLVEILNLETVLDAGYCAPKNGCDARAGRFNLYVPVSPFLPTIPLRLKFSVGDGLFVDNCQKLHHFKDKVCHNFDDATAVSRRLSETTFEVPAGGFLQSGYTFRVGYTTESCRMDSSQMGRAFDEYNIAFFRVCGDTATRQNATTN